MDNSRTKIVTIHDGLDTIDDPLLVELRMKFGDDAVEFFENSNEGLDYVLNNLDQKMVVLLDINFSPGEKSGIQVFEEIRKKTSLIYIILITADELSGINYRDLVSMINHDAFAIENVTADFDKVLHLINKAVHDLDIRVASVLEQWINSRSSEERQQLFIMTSDGKEYSLLDLLQEIRQQSELGMKMEKNILLLAIDLLTRGRERIRD